MKLSVLATGIVVVLLLGLSPLSATPVGILSATGSVRVTFTNMDFLPVGGGTGSMAINLTSSTGTFALLTPVLPGFPFASGAIGDLSSATEPAGVPITKTDFLTFTSDANLRYTLTLLYAGALGTAGCSSSAIGAECSPSVPGLTSPYNMVYDGQGTTVSFDVVGFFIAQGPYSETAYRGRFSTQFVGETIPQVLASLTPEGSYRDVSWSATFNSAIPEPATYALMGAGLLALGLFRRRR